LKRATLNDFKDNGQHVYWSSQFLHYLEPLFTECAIRNRSSTPLVSKSTILYESELVTSFLIA